LRLIESALPFLTPVQRHGSNRVEGFVDGNGALEILRKWPRERLHSRIFVEMNQAAERAFVKSEATGAVKPAKAGTADCADTLVVKRIVVDERGVTAGAEIVGLKGGGHRETGLADRNTGPFVKRLFTDAAFIRKKQRKNAVGDRSEG